ncbi:MAG TPA: glycosyltransferase family 4 protein [Candidatus Binataceae bacterium]|nr:glycosyltransferase family 4 protein [Candidatus Binataceae bacterium]
MVEATEPLPIDEGERAWRCGMLSAALLARGHEVRWWTSTFHHARKVHRLDAPQTIERQPGLTLRLLHGPGYRRNLSLARIRHHQVVAEAFAREAAVLSKPDLIFCCMPTPELAEKAVELGRRDGVPVVIDVRDLWPDSYLGIVPRPLRWIAKLALRSRFRRMSRICREARGLTAVSDYYLAWALAYAGRSRSVNDRTFPLAFPAPARPSPAASPEESARTLARFNLPAGAIVATFAGIFGSTYDLETVIEAARKLASSGIDAAHLVLAGDGEKTAKLKARARGLTNLTFTGWLDQFALQDLLAASAIGLAPYTSGAPQSMPNKPFEYMASGLALVSSLGGELGDLVRSEQIGLGYTAGDAASLAAAIELLCAKPALRRQMGANGRRIFAERFSDAVVYPALVQHLEMIANGQVADSDLRAKTDRAVL